LWTDIHIYGQTDRPEFQSVRSLLGDDLKIDHFSDVLSSQSLSIAPKRLNLTQQKQR